MEQRNREVYVYPGDLVTFKSKGGDRGTVSYLQDGKVAVLCVDGAVVEAEAGDLTVEDRSHLYLGQIVVPATDPGGQMGVVLGVHTTLDLVQFGDNDNDPAARAVSPAEVRRVREFNAGDYVVFSGQWLGRVVAVTVAEAGETTAVRVDWLASAELGTNQSDLDPATAPPAWQHSLRDDLTLFSSGAGSSSAWGVGDRCFFRGTATSVSDTRSTVDVVWQDGTRERGVPSASLLPFGELLNELEFFPGECLVARGLMDDATVGCDDNDDSEGSPGTSSDEADDDGNAGFWVVVRSFDSKGKTVRVADDVEETGEFVACAYGLERAYNDHGLFYGDVVVRRRPPGPSDDDKEEQGCNVGDDLSWVGRVVDLCDDGRAQVTWGNGTTSKVLSNEIYVVAGADYRVDTDADDEKSMHEESTAIVENAQVSTGDGFETSSVVDQDVNNDDDVSTEEEEEEAANVAACGSDESLQFLQFAVVPHSPPDHSYIDQTNQSIPGGQKWIKRVQKEWKILENSLPDTIYVRAYEDRMDLLRVAMVGAAGTPYQDGLFFFDLHLPSSYPAVPPQVRYHSFGLSLNLNLDGQSGEVCLSILDTTDGEGVELWSPATSTILQVVVSLQGHVLMAQPFYTESDYAEHLGTRKGARNEVIFAEDACLLTFRMMLHLLRRPPAGFEELVRGHFRRRGKFVIRACVAYLRKGCPVGALDAEGCAPEMSSDQRTCSEGFKLAVASFLPRLGQAFTAIGAEGVRQGTPTAT